MSHAFNLLQAKNKSTITRLHIDFLYVVRRVKLTLKFENSSIPYEITYGYHDEYTEVNLTEYNKVLVPEKNNIDVLCEDLLSILTNAKFDENLEIKIQYKLCDNEQIQEALRVYEPFKICSLATKTKLNVCSLHVQVDDAFKLRSISSCFKSNKLECLTIVVRKEDSIISDLEDIVEMNLWKNAKSIYLEGFLVSIPIDHFSHCENIGIYVANISTDDIQTFVKTVSNSKSFHKLSIRYLHLEEDVKEQLLHSLFGGKKLNHDGKLVRWIGNKLEFIHNPFFKTIYIHKLPEKHQDESIETPKTLISDPAKPAMLCFSNLLIMEKIVQHLDIFNLMALRKVSRGSRQCVESLKPDPKLVAINIFVEPEYVSIELVGRCYSKRILYLAPRPKRPEHCYIPYTNHVADLNNFSKDFFTIMLNQKSTLKACRFISNSDCENDMRSIIDGAWFSAEKLKIVARSLKTVSQILEHLDPISIKTIEIGNLGHQNIVQSTKNLLKFEQWKNASELKIAMSPVECDLEMLINFSKVNIWLKSISQEDVLYLREKFLKSSVFRTFKARFLKSNVNDSIFDDNFLGAPFRRVEDILSGKPHVWFFPYTDVMEDLQIRFYRLPKVVMFNRVPRQF